MAISLRELVTTWGFQVDDSELQKMKKTQEDLRKGFLKLGAVAAAALAAVVLPAAAVQANIKDTLTLVPQTGEAFAKLEKGMTEKALSLSNKLGISAAQVATGFYQVLSTGAEALSPQFNALSEIGLKMAKTVGLEPAVAIEKLNDTLNAFGLAATEAARVADVFFKTSILAATSVPQLAEAMTTAAPAAREFGISLEDTSALLGTLADAGIKGARAGTGFAGVLARLKKPTAEVQGALGALNVKLVDGKGNFRNFIDILVDMKKGMGSLTQAQQANVLTTIAGQEHSKTLSNLILKVTEKTVGMAKKLKDAEGALDRAFVVKMGSASEQFKLMTLNVKNFAAKIGAPLLGPITKVIEKIGQLTLKITEFMDNNPLLTEVVATFIGMASAIALIVSGLGVAITSFKLLVFFAGGALVPFIALVALLALLSLVLVTVKDEFDELLKINKDTGWAQIGKEFLGWITNIDEAKDALEELNKALQDLLENPLKETGAVLNAFFADVREKREDEPGLGIIRASGRALLEGTVFEGERSVPRLAPAAPNVAGAQPAVPLQQTTVSVGDIFVNSPNADSGEVAKEVYNEFLRNTERDLGL